MLRGRKIGLRARQQADVAVLHAELYEDVAIRSRADSHPWRPIPAESAASPFAPGDTGDAAACFSVVELASGELAGDALLWGIDLHNRAAHVGLSLRPTFRGRGLAPTSSACCAATASSTAACTGSRSTRSPTTPR
jgi:RimJ/RimL family protein N-acetyltransferase